MSFPIIHTNFWDSTIGIPVVLILTQCIKWFTPISRKYIPTVAVILGLMVSIFYSHPHDLVAGIFMGYFYGYAAIGSYAATKTSWQAFREEKRTFTQYQLKSKKPPY
ncbi:MULTISPECIES: hypothetical protein [Terribacillus]|uniref:Holin n=1 Tax=Terribacillus saccharophilus TaxID=361277 RepID=A0AAX2EDN4_9BACI|nr:MULTISPECIES: hypothetical protein [Terribacillus]SEM86646.1 hypothetical protein SAMN04489762_1242 [Terribacillus saccharophilus]